MGVEWGYGKGETVTVELEVPNTLTTQDLEAIAENLKVAFPTLRQVVPVRLIDVGFGSVVIETAGGIVFRVARSQAAGDGHARETRFLSALRPRVSVAVPNPR